MSYDYTQDVSSRYRTLHSDLTYAELPVMPPPPPPKDRSKILDAIIRLSIIIVLLCLGVGASIFSYQYGYQSGYSNGYAFGDTSGYQKGIANQKSADATKINNAVDYGYMYGVNYIECWVINNHAVVYSLYFNNAFDKAQC